MFALLFVGNAPCARLLVDVAESPEGVCIVRLSDLKLCLIHWCASIERTYFKVFLLPCCEVRYWLAFLAFRARGGFECVRKPSLRAADGFKPR